VHLMLRVRSGSTDQTSDVVATVEPTHTVDELRRALAAQPGVGPGPSLVRAASGAVLDPQASLAEVGLVSGEELIVGEQRPGFAPPATDAVVRIEAIGGPASGWRIELGPGTYTLGRPWSRGEDDPSYRAIPDAAVSRAHVAVVVGHDLSVTLRENPDATNPLLVDGERPEGPVVVDEQVEVRLGDSVLVCRPVDAAPPARIDQLGQVAFHRTPLRPARPEEVVIPPLTKVPGVPEPARFSWLASAAPLLGGVLMAAALQEPRFLIFVLLAPMTGAAGYFENRKRTRERHERELAAPTPRRRRPASPPRPTSPICVAGRSGGTARCGPGAGTSRSSWCCGPGPGRPSPTSRPISPATATRTWWAGSRPRRSATPTSNGCRSPWPWPTWAWWASTAPVGRWPRSPRACSSRRSACTAPRTWWWWERPRRRWI